MLKGLVFHGDPSLAESEGEEEEREIEKAYHRDKDGRLQAIWLIRLRDSNPVDPRRCRGTVYPTTFVVYQAKKRGPNRDCREKRLPLHRCHTEEIRILPEKLGRIAERFPFMHQINDIYSCITLARVCYLHYFLFFFYPIPFCFVSFFHPLFRLHIACPFDRIVNFLRRFCEICYKIMTRFVWLLRLMADPRYSSLLIVHFDTNILKKEIQIAKQIYISFHIELRSPFLSHIRKRNRNSWKLSRLRDKFTWHRRNETRRDVRKLANK